MNPTQKAYETYDLTLVNLKRSQSFYHIKNLGIIRQRKNQFKEKPEKIEHVPNSELTSKFELI